MSQKSPPPTAPPPIPGPLRWAGWLLTAEAAGMGAVAVFLVVQAITGEPVDRGEAAALAGFATFFAAFLALLAVALRRRAPRARAPAIVLQLMSVMVGVVLITSGQPWVGTPLVLLGATVVTLLFAPSTATALGSPGPSAGR